MSEEIETNTPVDNNIREDGDKELEEAVAKLKEAQRRHDEAVEEMIEKANEYLREGVFEEKVAEQLRNAQMANVNVWYRFWETATKIPKDNKYSTFTTNERRTWKTIIQSNEDFLSQVVDGTLDGVSWKKVMNKNGVKITFSPEKSEVFKTRLYKVEATLAATSPRVALLSILRGPIQGKEDKDLLYFREHYNFVGGTSSLVHSVRKMTADRLQPRDFFDLCHWSELEDGSVLFTCSSVKAFPNRFNGIVRGANLFHGIHLRPSGEDVEIMMLNQCKANGWAPNFYLNWNEPYALQRRMQAIQRTCDELMQLSGEERDELVRKWVLRQLPE